MSKISIACAFLAGTAALTVLPAQAAEKKPAVTLAKCDAAIGSIAVVDGDTQGWTKYGLSSPRDLIAAMAAQSGCFTLHNAASGRPADFLVNAVAGDKEEVDQGMEAAKGALMQGALRTGALSAVSRVPMAGQLMGMFGGMGGKKKTVAAGLKIMSPATGQVLVTGTGETSKSSVSFGGLGGGLGGGLASGLGGLGGGALADAARTQVSAMGYGDFANGGYATSKDGQMLTTAFIQAFNNVVSQAGALRAVGGGSGSAPAAPAAAYVTAIDTQLYAAAAKGAAVRSLRAGTSLTPTGKRTGLFAEVKDNYGTQGWVSVEDLK